MSQLTCSLLAGWQAGQFTLHTGMFGHMANPLSPLMVFMSQSEDKITILAMHGNFEFKDLGVANYFTYKELELLRNA